MIGKEVIRLNSVGSTNQYLQELLLTRKVDEGLTVIANKQLAGTGLSKNIWYSQEGCNITASILLRPTFLDPARQFELNKAISLAVIDCVNENTGLLDRTTIKWPNDIYIDHEKTAGILITQAIVGREIEYAIVGIGLNVNQLTFPKTCPIATSLSLKTETEHNLDVVFTNLLSCIDRWYQILKTGPKKLIDDTYLQCLYQYRSWHEYSTQRIRFTGMITGVNEYGRLQIKTNEGETKEFDLKEVVFERENLLQ